MEIFKMLKNKKLRVLAIVCITVLLSVAMVSRAADALISQNLVSWYWTSDTNVAAVATGDVNGDGQTEIVTAGYFNDGTRWVTQLSIFNGATLALLNVRTWYWTGDTQISSVAVANISGTATLDIVTGGAYFDGTRWVAQLSTWNGATLALENVRTWYWTGDTQISSVAVANINGGPALDIVTGGAYFDGTRWVAQLSVWNGATLALENVRNWYWTSNTTVNSIAIGDVNADGIQEIVTGGAFFDNTRWVSQLSVWNGPTLAINNVQTWYWTSDTEIDSVAIANINGGTALDIVTGGSYFDNTRSNAQLAVWNGLTLALENIVNWYWTSNTSVSSISIGHFSSPTSLDVVTAGTYNDGARNYGQVMDWDGATLTLKSSVATWFLTSNTVANSVSIVGSRIFVGGSFYDLNRANAQLTVWG
jgi:hypothetical protein